MVAAEKVVKRFGKAGRQVDRDAAQLKRRALKRETKDTTWRRRIAMTQMQAARQGIITEEMRLVAW